MKLLRFERAGVESREPKPVADQPAYRWRPLLLIPLLLGTAITAVIGQAASAGAAEQAPQVLTIEANQQMEFADRYFAEGEYDRAISEYRRFIYFFPDDPRVSESRMQIGKSYYQLGQYHQAIRILREMLKTEHDWGKLRRIYLLISRCYQAQRDFEQALAVLNEVLRLAADPVGDGGRAGASVAPAVADPRSRLRDEIHYEMAWIQLEQAKWAKARNHLRLISPVNRAGWRVATLLADLPSPESIATKDPAVAGGLAVVPGAGYLYCERPRDALIAFGLNAGLIYAAYEAFESDQEVLGGLLGLVAAGFYSGSIYGSINSARKFNLRQTRGVVEKLQQRHRVVISAAPTRSGAMVALRVSF